MGKAITNAKQASPIDTEIGSGFQVTINVRKLKNTGEAYSNALKTLRRCHGANIVMQSVEATVVGMCGSEDYICCFAHGVVHQQIVVPRGCFTRAIPPAPLQRVSPTIHNGVKSNFSAAAARRAVATIS